MQILLKNRWFLAAVVVIFLFNLFVMNGTAMLWDEDEAAYAGFAVQMLETGDWWIPQFEWSEIHRKPPLHFWTIALSYKLFGINEFATRLPSVLAILGTLFVLFFIGRKTFGRDTVLTACLVLMASLFLPNIAKIAVVDSSLLFCQTLSVLSLCAYMSAPAWRWNVLFWLGISLGLLLKGPPILILTGGLWLFLTAFHPQRKRLIGTHPWLFLPVAMLPLLAWGYVAWQRDPGFVTWLLDFYIFKRVGGSVLGQTGPPGYYLLVYVLSFFVFLPVLPAAFWDIIRRVREREGSTLMLAGWLVFGWLFYEILPSKLPTYALGALPAVAILIARQLLNINKENYPYKKWASGGSVFFVLLFFTLAVGMIYTAFILTGRETSVQVIFMMFLLWPLSFISGTLTFARRYVYGLGGLILTGLLFTTLTWLILLPHVEPLRDAPKRLAQAAQEASPEGTTILMGNDISPIPSIPFYLSQHFKYRYYYDDIKEVANKLRSPEPYTVIVGDEWKTILKQDFAATGDTLSSINIKGIALDHVSAESYWILLSE